MNMPVHLPSHGYRLCFAGSDLLPLPTKTWLASDYIVPDTPQQLPLGLSFAQNAQDRL